MNTAVVYITRCESAALMRAKGMKFKEIAAKLKVSKDRARTMVGRGLREQRQRNCVQK